MHVRQAPGSCRAGPWPVGYATLRNTSTATTDGGANACAPDGAEGGRVVRSRNVTHLSTCSRLRQLAAMEAKAASKSSSKQAMPPPPPVPGPAERVSGWQARTLLTLWFDARALTQPSASLSSMPPPPPLPNDYRENEEVHSRASDAGSVSASDAGSTATMDTSMSAGTLASGASTAFFSQQVV